MSRVLPLFKRQTKEVGELLPQLYLHGLALGDFELALRGLLGDGAPLSPVSLLRLKTQWQVESETWTTRRLDDLEVVYLRDEMFYTALEVPPLWLCVRMELHHKCTIGGQRRLGSRHHSSSFPSYGRAVPSSSIPRLSRSLFPRPRSFGLGAEGADRA